MTQSHMLKKGKQRIPVFTPSASFNHDTDRKDGKHAIVDRSTLMHKQHHGIRRQTFDVYTKEVVIKIKCAIS